MDDTDCRLLEQSRGYPGKVRSTPFLPRFTWYQAHVYFSAEATLTILSVDDQPSRDFQGLIRSQDIRQTEKDKVKVWLSFRPGDLYVLAFHL